jgi:integrase
MACVVKRRNKWMLDYRDQHGVRRIETTQGNKKDAELLLAQRLQEIGRGEFQPRQEEKTFKELVDIYTSNHIETNVRSSTRADYLTNLRLHLLPYFGRTRLRAITPEVVEAWRTWARSRNGGVRTINKSHMLLGAMLRYANRYRWVGDNPASMVKKLREGSSNSGDQPLEGNILTPAEVGLLLKHADERWRTAIRFAIETGLRQGEQLGLQWGDIDWASKQVHVRRQFSKGKFSDLKTKHSRRRVGLSEGVLSALRVWKLRCPVGEHDLVFPGDDGRPLNHGILLRSGFYPALRRAKLRHVRWHDLRHTFASLLIAANVGPKRIQALMGHSTIRITFDVYGHLLKDTDDGAAEKLSELLGSKVVATEDVLTGKVEAGVGIEPAYTALQAAA